MRGVIITSYSVWRPDGDNAVGARRMLLRHGKEAGARRVVIAETRNMKILKAMILVPERSSCRFDGICHDVLVGIVVLFSTMFFFILLP